MFKHKSFFIICALYILYPILISANNLNVRYDKPVVLFKSENKILNSVSDVDIWVVQEELLIKFDSKLKGNEIDEIVKKYNAEIIKDKLSKIGIYRIRLNSNRDLATLIKEISKEPGVLNVEPNFIGSALSLPRDSWNFEMIKTDTNINISSSAVVNVAIIDSGIDNTHPDLESKISAGYNFLNNTVNTSDDYGHGTFLAGIVASMQNSNSKVIPYKVLNQYGFGEFAVIANALIRAADDAQTNKTKILLLSFGGYVDSMVLREAIKYAHKKGLTIISSMGNDNKNLMMYPAAYPDVIAVSTVDSTSVRWEVANYGNWIDICAPGVDIKSTARGGGYMTDSGTSVSAAHVAGACSLLYQKTPNLSPDEIRYLITSTATDLGDEGFDIYYGNGLLNIKNALVSGKIINVDTNACRVIAFGPKEYIREKGAPKIEKDEFNAIGGKNYKIEIYNGGFETNDETSRVSSCEIYVNGSTILVDPKSINKNVDYLEKNLTLENNNTISVELKSEPGTKLIIQIISLDANGNCPKDGTPENPYTKISEALSSSSNGDIIFVKPGTYNETIIIPKNVTVKSNCSQEEIENFSAAKKTILNAGGNDIAVTLNDGAKLEGFTITNAVTAVMANTANTVGCSTMFNIFKDNPYAINAKDSKIKINNNIFENTSLLAIEFTSNIDSEIVENQFRNNPGICIQAKNGTWTKNGISRNVMVENGFIRNFLESPDPFTQTGAIYYDTTQAKYLKKREVRNIIQITNTSPSIFENNLHDNGELILIVGPNAKPEISFNLLGKAVSGCTVFDGAAPVFRNNLFTDHDVSIKGSGKPLITNNRFIGVHHSVNATGYELYNNSILFAYRPGEKDYEIVGYNCWELTTVIGEGKTKNNIYFGNFATNNTFDPYPFMPMIPANNLEFSSFIYIPQRDTKDSRRQNRWHERCYGAMPVLQGEGTIHGDPLFTNLQNDNFIPYFNFEKGFDVRPEELVPLQGTWEKTPDGTAFTGISNSRDSRAITLLNKTSWPFKDEGYKYKAVVRWELEELTEEGKIIETDDVFKLASVKKSKDINKNNKPQKNLAKIECNNVNREQGTEYSGFIFNYQDPDNYYFAGFGKYDGTKTKVNAVMIGQRRNGIEEVIFDTSVGVTTITGADTHKVVEYDMSLSIYKAPAQKSYNYNFKGGFRGYFYNTTANNLEYLDNNYVIIFEVKSHDPMGRDSANKWTRRLSNVIRDANMGYVGFNTNYMKTKFSHVRIEPIQSPVFNAGNEATNFNNKDGSRNDIGEFGGISSASNIILRSNNTNICRMYPSNAWESYANSTTYKLEKAFKTRANQGSKAEYTISAPRGTYEIYIWWSKHENLAKDVPVTITDSESNNKTFIIDLTGKDKYKRWSPGRWNRIGTAEFDLNDKGKLTISDKVSDSGSYILADAIMLIKTTPDKLPPYFTDENPWNNCTRVLRNGYSGISFQDEFDWPFTPTGVSTYAFYGINSVGLYGWANSPRYNPRDKSYQDIAPLTLSNSFVEPGISVLIRDDGAGVDRESIKMHITSSSGKNIYLDYKSPQLKIDGTPRNIIVKYILDFLFDYEEIVTVHVSADDLAIKTHHIEETYTFQVKPEVDPPTTTAFPGWGIYNFPLTGENSVIIAADEPCEIYYTLSKKVGDDFPEVNGPTTLHQTAVETDFFLQGKKYTYYTIKVEIPSDTYMRFFGIDLAGNKEEVAKTVHYIINTGAPNFSDIQITKSKTEEDTILISFVSDQVLGEEPAVSIDGAIATMVEGKYIDAGTYGDTIEQLEKEYDGNIFTKNTYIFKYKKTGKEATGANEISISGTGLQTTGESGAILPGKTGNSIIYIDIDYESPTPVTSIPGGTYNGKQTVTLSASEEAVIYYTLDGFEPKISDSPFTKIERDTILDGAQHPIYGSTYIYNGPITIDRNTIVRYTAVDKFGNVSNAAEQVYFIMPAGPKVYVKNGGYSSIQKAIDDTAKTGGGEVIVYPGTYNEDITVKTGVSVHGYNIYSPDEIILNGIIFLEDFTAVTGLTIKKGITEISNVEKTSVVLKNLILGRDIIFTNSFFLAQNIKNYSKANGIIAMDSYLHILDSDFKNNLNGVYLYAGKSGKDYTGCRGKVLNSKFENCKYALDVHNSQISLIKDNIFLKNERGILLDYTIQDNKYTRVKVNYNIFYDNDLAFNAIGTGVDVYFTENVCSLKGEVTGGEGVRLNIFRNYFRDKLWYYSKHIYFNRSSHGIVANNIFTDCWNGIATAASPATVLASSPFLPSGVLMWLNNIVDGGYGQNCWNHWSTGTVGYDEEYPTNKKIPLINFGNIVTRLPGGPMPVDEIKKNVVDFDADNYTLKPEADYVNQGKETPVFEDFKSALNYYESTLMFQSDPWENWTLFNDHDGSYNDTGLFGGPFAFPPVIVDNSDTENIQLSNPGALQKISSATSFGEERFKNYLYFANENAVTITPDVKEDGYYDMYLWWPDVKSLSDNAKITFNTVYPEDYTGEAVSITLDQSKNGYEWNKIRTVKLNKGSKSNIVLSGKNFAFDAVKFVKVPPDKLPPYINNIGQLVWMSRTPRDGTYGVEPEAQIKFAVMDCVSGVEKDSIKIKVTSNGQDVPGMLHISGSPRRYQLAFEADERYAYEADVNVEFTANDLLIPKRTMIEKWSFKIIKKNYFHVDSGFRDVVKDYNEYWAEDKQYTERRGWGYEGGHIVKVIDYGERPAYHWDGTARMDSKQLKYKFNVDNGLYYVRMNFYNFYNAVGKKGSDKGGRFNVTLEDDLKLEGYSVEEDHTEWGGHFYPFIAEVKDGQLNIDLFNNEIYKGNPSIADIDIAPYTDQPDITPPYVIGYGPHKGQYSWTFFEPYLKNKYIYYTIKDDQSGVNPDSIGLNVYGLDVIPEIIDKMPNITNTGYNYKVRYKLSNIYIDVYNPMIDIGITARDNAGNLMKWDYDKDLHRVKHPKIIKGGYTNGHNVGTHGYIAQHEIMVYDSFYNHDFEEGQLWPWHAVSGFEYQPANIVDNDAYFERDNNLSNNFTGKSHDFNANNNYFLSFISAPPGFELDEKDGELNSGTFKITQGEINCLVSEGTKVEVHRIMDEDEEINYDVLASVTGTTSEYMTRKYMDVSKYIGSTVYLKVTGCTGADDFNVNVKNNAKGLFNPTFNSGNLEGWEIESGTAFTKNVLSMINNRYVLTTLKDGENIPRGTLKSSTFILNGKTLQFKIGGTQNIENCYIALYVAEDIPGVAKVNEILKKATGDGTGNFITINWDDLTPYIGKKVYIKIVLNDGYIMFSDLNVNAVSEFKGENILPSVLMLNSSSPYQSEKEIRFSAVANDTDGYISSYFWDFGDGTTSTLQNPKHTFINPEKTRLSFTITLKVTDNKGGVTEVSKIFTVESNDYVSPYSLETILPNPKKADKYEDDNTYIKAQKVDLTLPVTDTNSFTNSPQLDIISTLSQYHTLNNENDEDWFILRLFNTKSYSVRTSPITDGLDTIVKIYKFAPNNEPVYYTENDDGGPSTGSLISYNITDGYLQDMAHTGRQLMGTHYVQVIHNKKNPIVNGTYRIEISCDAVEDAYEDDNKADIAKQIQTDVEEVQNHTFAPFNDVDWIKFQGYKGHFYKIQTSNLLGGADTVIQLYSIDKKTLIKEDDESGEEYHSSMINFFCSQTGIYYIKIIPYNAVYGRGSYSLSVIDNVKMVLDMYEYDDKSSDANQILVSDNIVEYTQEHNFLPPGNTDWIKFNVTDGNTYLLECIGITDEASSVITVYDNNLKQIIKSDDNSGNISKVNFVLPRTTTPFNAYYYARISPYNEIDGTGTYIVKITSFNIELTPDAFENDNTKSSASNFTIDPKKQDTRYIKGKQPHTFYPYGDEDWVFFNAEKDKWYIIKTGEIAVGADTVIELYDDNGNLITQDDESGLDHASTIVWQCIIKGKYYLKIMHYNKTGTGSYTLSITDADIAAQTKPSIKSTYYVPDNFLTIQEAIDQAKTGDTIKVAAGVYKENIIFRGKGIVLESIDGPLKTVIQGNGGTVVTINQNEPSGTVLRGFSITGGNANAGWEGGGISIGNSSPEISYNWIYRNKSLLGGGILAGKNSSPKIINNTIVDNIVNTFEKVSGGGIYVTANGALITGNKISNNTYTQSGKCGGVAINGGYTEFYNNEVTNNSGDGILISDNSSTIYNNDIHDNSGSSISIIGKSKPYIINNIITQKSLSSANAVSIDGANASAYLIQNTMIGSWKNSFNLINGSYILVKNSIVWGHESIAQIEKGSTLRIKYSNVKGGFEGAENIDRDPQLNDDYTLKNDSPCIDAGSINDSISTDKLGNKRDNKFDMGALEYIRSMNYKINASEKYLDHNQQYSLNLYGNNLLEIKEIYVVQKGHRSVKAEIIENIDVKVNFKINTNNLIPGSLDLLIVNKEDQNKYIYNVFEVNPKIYFSKDNTDFKSISEIFQLSRDKLTPGTIIELAPGNYNESVNISYQSIVGYPIILRGSDKNNPPIINGGITIKDSYLINIEELKTTDVYIPTSQLITLKKIIISGNGIGSGIYLASSNNCYFSELEIFNAKNGIDIFNSRGTIIKNSKIDHNKSIGINVYRNSTLWTENIILYGNDIGLYLTTDGYYNNAYIKNSIITNNNYGLKNQNGFASEKYFIEEDYNLISGNYMQDRLGVDIGLHSISGDPGFVNPSIRDFRIYQDSDIGTNENTFGLETIPVQTSNRTYFVHSEGNNSNDGLADTPDRAFATIQYAIDNAIATGDEIIVNTGEYKEDVVITKGGSSAHPITIRANGEVTIIPKVTAFTLNRVSGINIEGFKIKGGKNAIIAEKSLGIKIKNIKISDCTENGITFKNIYLASIANTTVSNCKNGLYGEKINKLEISASNFDMNKDYGIYFISSNNISLENISTSANITGLSFSVSNGNINNSIVDYNSLQGIKIDTGSVVKVNHSVIYNNYYSAGINKSTGIFEIKNSIIAGNHYGLQNASGTVTENNNIIYDNFYWNREDSYNFGTNSINDDPKFFNAQKRDYRVYVGSPVCEKADDGEDIGKEYKNSPVSLNGVKVNLNPYNALAFWNFENRNSLYVKNNIESSENATIVNNVTWKRGLLGNGLEFKVSNDYVEVTNYWSLNEPSEYSVEMWIKIYSDSNGSIRYLISKSSSISSNTFAICVAPNNRRLFFTIADNNKINASDYSQNEIPLNEWTHIVLVAGRKYGAFYINGKYDGYLRIELPYNDTGRLSIGGKYGNSSFNGIIDEVVIYGRALSADEITARYKRMK